MPGILKRCERNTMAAMVLSATRAALVFFASGLGAAWSGSVALAQVTANDVAYVVAVAGRAVASSRGATMELDVLDTIDNQTRLDLEPNTEVRICHYRALKILTLKGPLRALISDVGVTLENGNEIPVSGETCAKPVVSTVQGGAVFRNLNAVTNVGLRPRIKIVNSGSQKIRKVIVRDELNEKILTSFKRNVGQPQLAEGRTYTLVVEFANGGRWEMKLRASAAVETGAVIITFQ
jgi:hypothetical protein